MIVNRLFDATRSADYDAEEVAALAAARPAECRWDDDPEEADRA